MSRVWKVFANFAPDSFIDVRIASLRMYCEHADSKDEWLALQERISEQVEELKKLVK